MMPNCLSSCVMKVSPTDLERTLFHLAKPITIDTLSKCASMSRCPLPPTLPCLDRHCHSTNDYPTDGWLACSACWKQAIPC